MIEIYKKKKKTLLKSYYFYLETKMRMQKSEIFMGFTFIICIIIKFFFGVLSEIRWKFQYPTLKCLPFYLVQDIIIIIKVKTYITKY